MLSASFALPRSLPVLKAAASGDNPLLGILLVLGSTVFLSASDASSKLLSASLPGIEIAWLRYAGFTAIMLLTSLASPGRRIPRAQQPLLQLLRGLGLVGSAILFIMALSFLPVAEATAISFVSPLFVTALSIPLLGEKVGIRRWAAAFFGFLGVVVIVRPGTGAFQFASLLPIASALFWAGALVATRKIGRGDPARTTMTYSALIGFALLTLLVPTVWVTPRWDQVLLGGCIGLASTVGHWIVTIAYRHAGASVLVPFSYSQIVWATAFGLAIFGTVPDRWTFAGAAIVIASGFYTAHRERVRSRAAQSDRKG